ncbi:MAG: HNH endonuclease [Candidatus Heimdallarchaeota archaeon]
MLTSLPSKAEIVNYWKDWLIENGFDLGEPSCWACEWGWNGKYDIIKPDASWEEIRKAWEAAPLQRCHVLAHSLGGPDDVSNLFLMCRECHDLAPNTTSQEAFLKWADSQNWFNRKINRIQEEAKAFNIKEEDFEEFTTIINSPGFKKWIKKNATLHFSQRGYGLDLTISTLVAAIWEYQKRNSSKRPLKSD